MVKNRKGQLRSSSRIRAALKEFFRVADDSLCKTEAEASKVLESKSGYRLIEGVCGGTRLTYLRGNEPCCANASRVLASIASEGI